MLVRTESKYEELLTPKVDIKKTLKKIIVSGQSSMTDPGEFYTQLASDIEAWFTVFGNKLTIVFFYDYINTGSVKWLYHLIKHIQNLVLDDGEIDIFWKYEEDDESIQETGEILQSMTRLSFQLQPF